MHDYTPIAVTTTRVGREGGPMKCFLQACIAASCIVAGQLQHHLERHELFKPHQVKIRSIVAPGAVVDGWGDVAPIGD